MLRSKANRGSPRRRAPGLALALAALILAGPTFAQTAVPRRIARALEGAAPAEVGERAAALMAEITAIEDDYLRYHALLPDATSEDSLVLGIQIERAVDEFIVAVRALADVTPTPDQEAVYGDLRSRLAHFYPRVTPRIWAAIAADRAKIDALRARRADTPAKQRLKLADWIDHETRRLDLAFQFASEHLLVLEAFGLDTTEERKRYRGLLAERADELSGRIELTQRRLAELSAETKVTPDLAAVKLDVAAMRRLLHTETTSLGVVIELMREMRMDTENLRLQLVSVTHDLTASLGDSSVARELVRSAWNRCIDWLRTSGPRVLVEAVVLVVILVAGRLLAGLVRAGVRKSLDRTHVGMSQLLRRTLVSLAFDSVLVLTAIVALWQLGISLGPILAGLGVAGFVIGFAMQDSLANFAAGLMILVYRPFDVGDLVEVSGAFGEVKHMSMVNTTVLTIDNQKLVVPNNKVWTDVIKNLTDQHLRRVDMTFGISYGDDIDQAEAVLCDIVATHAKVLAQPEPMVRLHRLGESAVEFVVRPWVKTADYWEVYWDVTRAVKTRFDAEGITIPFPQRQVHLQVAPTAAVATASVPPVAPPETVGS